VIVDLMFKTPGFNLIPVSMQNRNTNNLAQSVNGNPNANDTDKDEEENVASAMDCMMEDINTSINTQMEKNARCTVNSQILYTLEYLRMLGALTEFDNFYTESIVKDVYNTQNIMDMIDSSGDFILMSRRALALLMNAFMDLEEVEDNQTLEIAEIAQVIKSVITVVSKSVSYISQKDTQDKKYYMELTPDGVVSFLNY